MDKVWAVSCGEYSDYSIVRVFSTEALADEYARFKNRGWRRYRVEEWDVDSDLDSLLPVWSVEDRSVMGRGLTATEVEYFSREIGEVWEVDDYRSRMKWPTVTVRAKDKESAIKIAAEKFAQFKAEKAGIV